MKISFIILGVLVFFVLGGLLVLQTGRHQNMTSTSVAMPFGSSMPADKAPDFHLQDYNGKTVNLADFAGKPLVINSWASWCPFCVQELPDFAAAQKEFGNKVTIIAINRAESPAVAKGYTDQQGTTHKLIFLLDASDSFYQSIGGFSMPETIFVTADGSIVAHKRGPMNLDEMRSRVKEAFGL